MPFSLQRVLFLVRLLCACRPTKGLEDGLARTPPMGWRSWNLFGKNVNQDLIMGIMDGMVSRKRKVDGIPTSLCDLGYCNVGLDDNWMVCTNLGQKKHTYHDPTGNPMVNKELFPDMLAMTTHAHNLNLTAGWYFNNCLCHDHGCNSPRSEKGKADRRCYEGDVKALAAFGFDGVKLDACGELKDLDLWWELIKATDRPIVIENCHWGQTVPTSEWCPFHFYRTAGDVRATYGAIIGSLQSVMPFARNGLSRPGCWAYPDMLEVGCKDGPNGVDDEGLNDAETRTHFGAWAIVSSPLILSHDVNDDEVMDQVWPVISNPEVIHINQAWAGVSGEAFKQASNLVIFKMSTWRVATPAWWYLYKPINDDKVAVLLINSSSKVVDLVLNFVDVPDLKCATVHSTASLGCTVRDVWQRRDIGVFTESFVAKDVAAHDCAFLTITTGNLGPSVERLIVETKQESISMPSPKQIRSSARNEFDETDSQNQPEKNDAIAETEAARITYSLGERDSTGVNSFHFVLAGPLMAVVVVALTGAMYRYSQRTGRRSRR